MVAARAESAAVHVYHNGPFAVGDREAGGPDVQAKTVLSRGRVVGAVEEVAVLVMMWGIVARLVPGKSDGAHVPPLHATSDSGPRRRFGGTAEARGTAGGRTIGDAFECVDVPRHV